MNTALEAVVKVTFASSSSQDHGLDDILRAGEIFGDGLGFILVGGNTELLDSDTKLLKQALGLVLQKVEVSALHLVEGGGGHLQQLGRLAHLGHSLVQGRHVLKKKRRLYHSL